MLKNIFANLFTMSSVIGVDLEFAGEMTLISSCKLSIKGSMLSSSAAHSGLKSVLHFAKQYHGGAVVLNVRGKGVLVRALEQLDVLDQKALHRILPNANLGDFYHQLAQTPEGTTLALIRKKEADGLIEEFDVQGYSVIGFTLDGFSENAAYQAGFLFLAGDPAPEIQSTAITAAKLQAKAKATLRGVGLTAGPSLLILLLLNFFVFNHYTSLLANCTFRSNSSASQVNRIKAMESHLLEQTVLIKEVGWAAGMRYSNLADQLLAKMPAQIRLQEMAINPIDTRNALNTSQPSYRTSTVTFSGSCSNAAELNDWLFSLKSYRQVGDCSIENYAVNSDSGRGQFSIMIRLSDDKL